MNVWLKRIGYTIGALIALLLIVVSFVYGMSERQFRRIYSVASETIPIADDSATLARGEHLAIVFGCADCHGEGLAGAPVIDTPPLGRVVALNLTRGNGGVGATLTPELIERAVRHGVAPNGRPLLIMPSIDFQYMSDGDLHDIASYVMHLTPVNKVLPPTHVALLPRALMLAGQMPLLSAPRIVDSAGTPMAVAAAPTSEYGAYLTIVGGCRFCHGPGFSGGKVIGGDPAWIPAANITTAGAIGKWTEAEFMSALRTGKRADGSTLKDPMPWPTIGTMSDDELDAIWKYLHTLPPRDFGNR
jgi:mono/diheme cytochrome c family protein